MKRLFLILTLLAAAPACKTLDSLLAVPAAAAADIGGVIPDPAGALADTADIGGVIPDPAGALADTAGAVAQTGTTLLTGNGALGAMAGALVTGLAAFMLGKRKKPA